MYKKITEESLLNIKRVDQVTFSSSPERFFIGEGAKITMTGEGIAIYIYTSTIIVMKFHVVIFLYFHIFIYKKIFLFGSFIYFI